MASYNIEYFNGTNWVFERIEHNPFEAFARARKFSNLQGVKTRLVTTGENNGEVVQNFEPDLDIHRAIIYNMFIRWKCVEGCGCTCYEEKTHSPEDEETDTDSDDEIPELL